MKNKLRQKIPKCRTKKGMSLVELIVGVTIIAMVLASASGIIVTGYKTTIDNAARNRAAASSASMNEVILKAVKNCGFSEKGEADELFFLKTDNSGAEVAAIPSEKDDEPVFAAVKKLYPDVKYSTTDSFSADDGDYQYTLNTDAKRTMEYGSGVVETIEILGIEITTAVAAAGGFEEIVSFVPYNDQDFDMG